MLKRGYLRQANHRTSLFTVIARKAQNVEPAARGVLVEVVAE